MGSGLPATLEHFLFVQAFRGGEVLGLVEVCSLCPGEMCLVRMLEGNARDLNQRILSL